MIVYGIGFQLYAVVISTTVISRMKTNILVNLGNIRGVGVLTLDPGAPHFTDQVCSGCQAIQAPSHKKRVRIARLA